MTDLVELRAVAADVRYMMDGLSADTVAWAADEIERLQEIASQQGILEIKLRLEIERLQKLLQIVDDNGREKDKLAAEVERLQAGQLSDALTEAQIEIERLQAMNCMLSDALAKAQIEVEQLK